MIYVFSDVDIKAALAEKGRNDEHVWLEIYPYDQNDSSPYVTPVGYDLRIGEKGFSWKQKKEFNIEQDKKIEIRPGDTVVIQTFEKISLSKNVAGTIHSMVSRVVPNALSHISTTVDPGWSGKMLVSFHNFRDTSVVLEYKSPFCTICFYQVKQGAKGDVRSSVDQSDNWDRLQELARNEKTGLEQEVKERRIWLGSFFIISFFAATILALCKPNFGASIAAVIGGFSPIVTELIKSRKN
ncbi:MAG: deoxycytidine deaminase [Chloroflexaceae bacterium]|nr:deoxycytidine deaminase [Chloroflexaceae bacterium]